MAAVLAIPLPQRSCIADGASSWSVGEISRVRIVTPTSQQPMDYAGAKSCSLQHLQCPPIRRHEITDGIQTLNLGTFKRSAFDQRSPATPDGSWSVGVSSLFHPSDAENLSIVKTAKRAQNLEVPDGSKTWCLGRRMVEGSEVARSEILSAATEIDGTKTWSASGGRLRPMRQNVYSSKDTISVSVIAPGGGTTFNAEAYALLRRYAGFQLDIVGQSRAPYDRYPPSWKEGAPAPNLETFSADLLSQGIVEKSTCLIFGSRGGQVVLPFFWRERGAQVPPAICINGGCAMKLPCSVHWPEDAVTFLLFGGQDYFKGHQTSAEFMSDCRSRVPRANETTALLLVNEMPHMPQTNLLKALLPHAITAIVSWRTSARVVRAEFDSILQALISIGYSGRLQYTSGPASWESFFFDHNGVVRQ